MYGLPRWIYVHGELFLAMWWKSKPPVPAPVAPEVSNCLHDEWVILSNDPLGYGRCLACRKVQRLDRAIEDYKLRILRLGEK